jgi:hypothetical protein
MSHVVDDLELYATGALPPDLSAGVAAHLERCIECRAAAAEIAEIVGLLADAVPAREPPPNLRERILVAARSGRGREPRPSILELLRPRLGALAVAAAIALLIGVDANAMIRAQEAQAQLATLGERFSHADRSWYMAGLEEWKGAGGSLVVQSNDRSPFVLFHDLRELPQGQMYAVWLISPEGRWVRARSFDPDGNKYQLVDVGIELAGFDRCAVTVEGSASGKRDGPIVMQSRIAPPSQ